MLLLACMTAIELRELRESHGLSMAELARRIGYGMDHTRISRFEGRKRDIPQYWVPLILQAFERLAVS